MSEKLVLIKCADRYSSLSEASIGVKEIKSKLQNNNLYATPMLYVHPLANSYEHFNNLITSPYVTKKDMSQVWEEYNGTYWFSEPVPLDVKVPANNIDDYAKIFDVLKVSSANYWHVGVYVGNGKVCHFSKEKNGTYIDSWEVFKKIDISLFIEDNSEAVIYHPVIPFKHYWRITQQIAYCVLHNFRQGDYDLANRNCEHFANMIVLGINYSEQIENSRGASIASFFGKETNNGKGSTIKLTNEMGESNNKLGITTNNLSEEIERRYLQEIPTNNCRIM